MAEIKLNKSKMVLLMADFHTGGMGQNPIVKDRPPSKEGLGPSACGRPRD
jgi:hypothetical protein